ncbi:MAG: ABC transporter ATP-binding protein [Nitrospinae bacterium]|jgi:ABC-2 type transport system ATP-binding protein|nr:ABC transporter ATP-binding protein [Nitrospinota bacterium]MDA1110637.1 ABC transporter ATP-binding protein [Nitrospinota bacterium]
MIEVENLTKFYGPRPAIKGITFNVNKGEVVGFLGPNGAGKSTTMNILCCIMPASSGSARICGHDVFEESMEIRKKIGYLPETPPLYPDMTVTSYLQFAARIRRVPSKKVSAAVDRVLEKCVLKDVRDRIIKRLSKGFQQRVGLAQSMIHDPEILILDEPTIGLDPIQIIEIRKLIQELANSHTIILSSHILPEITQICKRVIILNEGEIAAVDTLEGLTSSLNKSERFILKVRNSQNGISEKLGALENVISVKTEKQGQFLVESEMGSHLQDQVARLALENSWGIEELKIVSMTLEDIFLRLTLEENQPNKEKKGVDV